jgi:hypothetical protein
MALTGWVPIHKYRPYHGWVFLFVCGHHRYSFNRLLWDQRELHCFHCERPRAVTGCLALGSNLD